jgi:hypothetical protein
MLQSRRRQESVLCHTADKTKARIKAGLAGRMLLFFVAQLYRKP